MRSGRSRPHGDRYSFHAGAAPFHPSMVDPAFAALVVGLAVQYPIALLIYLDARRRGLRDPGIYGLGIVVPAAGFVVALYYLSERDGLPTADDVEVGDG